MAHCGGIRFVGRDLGKLRHSFERLFDPVRQRIRGELRILRQDEGIDDVVGIITTMLDDEQMVGAYNLVAPEAVTNYTFTKSLGTAMKRPTLFPMPAFIARILFGEMADALLLSSSRVAATRLKSLGYTFRDTELTATLTRLIHDNH